MTFGKNILGGVFKPLTLEGIMKKVREKFSYILPREEVNGYLDELTRYVGHHPSDPLTDPPRIIPRIICSSD
jgi:hypothetical protein